MSKLSRGSWASLLLLVALWQVLAVSETVAFLPTPGKTLSTLIAEAQSGELWMHLGITLRRVAICFAVAMLTGTLMGVAMGLSPKANAVLDPWLVVLLNVPALVIIILCYLSLGLVEAAALLAVILNKIPNVAVILREGSRSFDPSYTALAVSYRLPWGDRLRHILLPQLAPYLAAAARSGLALIWKIVLVVELLGRSNGVGFQLHSYFQLFDVAGILAYSLSFIVVVQGLEWSVLRPLERHATRWKPVPAL
jgi:NitT/TauT family transport system permease protein